MPKSKPEPGPEKRSTKMALAVIGLGLAEPGGARSPHP